jgi:hypothetical protein
LSVRDERFTSGSECDWVVIKRFPNQRDAVYLDTARLTGSTHDKLRHVVEGLIGPLHLLIRDLKSLVERVVGHVGGAAGFGAVGSELAALVPYW